MQDIWFPAVFWPSLSNYQYILLDRCIFQFAPHPTCCTFSYIGSWVLSGHAICNLFFPVSSFFYHKVVSLLPFQVLEVGLVNLPSACASTESIMAGMSQAQISYQTQHINDDRSSEILGTVISMAILSTAAVVVRFACRKKSKVAISYDDYATLLGQVCAALDSLECNRPSTDWMLTLAEYRSSTLACALLLATVRYSRHHQILVRKTYLDTLDPIILTISLPSHTLRARTPYSSRGRVQSPAVSQGAYESLAA